MVSKVEWGGEVEEMWCGEHIGGLYVASLCGAMDLVHVEEDRGILPLFINQ
jgi:hypothetical protein